jgi:hypothetical protein
MGTFWKYLGIVIGVGLLLGGAGAYLHHAGYTEGQQDAIHSPADTVTVLYPVLVPVKTPPPLALILPAVVIHDVSMPNGEPWHSAHVDTVVGKTEVKIDYFSPVPLSPRGYFSLNIEQIGAPDSIIVQVPGKDIVHYVEVTKYDWRDYIIAGLAGVAIGVTADNLIRNK